MQDAATTWSVAANTGTTSMLLRIHSPSGAVANATKMTKPSSWIQTTKVATRIPKDFAVARATQALAQNPQCRSRSNISPGQCWNNSSLPLHWSKTSAPVPEYNLRPISKKWFRRRQRNLPHTRRVSRCKLPRRLGPCVPLNEQGKHFQGAVTSLQDLPTWRTSLSDQSQCSRSIRCSASCALVASTAYP